ncbi:MAG: hypothetical protein PHW01_05265 [Patescibacteria group bacterium]|nr:hypothetical protein [Patescibacteria group bacterium]
MKRFITIVLLTFAVLITGCVTQDESAKVLDKNGKILVDLDHIRNCIGKEVVIEFEGSDETRFDYGVLYQVIRRQSGKLDCYICEPTGNNANIELWDARSIRLVSVSNPPLQIEVMKLPEKGGEK